MTLTSRSIFRVKNFSLAHRFDIGKFDLFSLFYLLEPVSVATRMSPATINPNDGRSPKEDVVVKVTKATDRMAAVAIRRYKPFISYELAVWLVYGVFTILAIVDRFVWNVWPRQMYHIGKGSAGTDFVDGLKPGPWSVQFYDICARVSGRYSIVALNLLLFTMMKTSMSWIAETWVAQYVLDFSDSHEGNHRLHKYNGILICILTLAHVWSILVPPIFNGFQAKVVLGSFEWPLSERNPSGFKDVNPNTETVMLQGDDVYRIIEMTLLLGVLMPLSIRWFQTKWHLGIHVHNFISVAYFVDIVRRHTHPHSWILNTPFFFAWLLDVIASIFWRRNRPTVYRKYLSEDYMLLFWKQPQMLATVGPKYYLRLKPSSFLERAHVFTAFENRCGLPMADGKEWSVGLLVRVYRNKRCPRLGKIDKVSHTQRVFEMKDLNLTTWGPCLGSMSASVKWNLHYSKELGMVAGGSAAGYLIDALQQHRGSEDAKLTVLYTTRDTALFLWVAQWTAAIIGTNRNTNVNVLLALTNKDGQNTVMDTQTEIDFHNLGYFIRVQHGRINFVEEVPGSCKVFFQGSGGLQRVVHNACKLRKSCMIAGPAFDQDTNNKNNKGSFGDYWRRMNCFVGEPETQTKTEATDNVQQS
eukprot:TRINITY_DN27568_c0_g2_i1.p2 TRINITY_DN27568_c0_g2~~TRINITY_DN27568_c0_g2_i1.p2  ORF type:complete len:639 (-),score=41.23 TRINITY_DN27568_c0_g2_i1:1098-3014(-)